MNREPLLKLSASQEIEALLSDAELTHKNQDNWLLSYLDVFVLIIMLVITLLAITDFNASTIQQHTKKIVVKKPAKKITKKLTKKTSSKQSSSNDLQPNTTAYKSQFDSPSKETLSKKPTKEPSPTKKNIQTRVEPDKKIHTLPSAEEKTPLTPNSTLTTKTNKELNTWKEQLKNNLDHFKLNQFVNIKVREGYAQIEIQNNVLFDSAQAQLTEEGQILIEKLTDLLKQSDGVIFVEGHTDNQPIASPNFPSNWELGSARATSVLHFLISQGINGNRLRAVSYADTLPLADNSTNEGRRKNRRVNLLVKLSKNKQNE